MTILGVPLHGSRWGSVHDRDLYAEMDHSLAWALERNAIEAETTYKSRSCTEPSGSLQGTPARRTPGSNRYSLILIHLSCVSQNANMLYSLALTIYDAKPMLLLPLPLAELLREQLGESVAGTSVKHR